MIQTGDKIGIVCCSNGLKKERAEEVGRLEKTLRAIGLEPVLSDYIYVMEGSFNGTGEERARALMDFYKDDGIKGIFDISGGDLANGILPYLDYDVIAGSDKTLWGYSDLTAVLNAIYARTRKACVLYQIRNMLYDCGERQRADFGNTVINGRDDLFHINYRFLSADTGYQTGDTPGERCMDMQGIVVGGNIRCLLKLAGTQYMPDLEDKILLLKATAGRLPGLRRICASWNSLGRSGKWRAFCLGHSRKCSKRSRLRLWRR